MIPFKTCMSIEKWEEGVREIKKGRTAGRAEDKAMKKRRRTKQKDQTCGGKGRRGEGDRETEVEGNEMNPRDTADEGQPTTSARPAQSLFARKNPNGEKSETQKNHHNNANQQTNTYLCSFKNVPNKNQSLPNRGALS